MLVLIGLGNEKALTLQLPQRSKSSSTSPGLPLTNIGEEKNPLYKSIYARRAAGPG